MRTSILLSGRRDLDLIALYHKVGSSEFSGIMKDALRMIVRGEKKNPGRCEGLILQGALNEENIRINLILTSEKDEDVRELLSHILPGKLGFFIKEAIRFYLGPAATLSGFMDSEFSGMLQTSAVPIQVFAIGQLRTDNVKPKKKKRKQPQAQKKRNIRKKENIVVKEPVQPILKPILGEPQQYQEYVKPATETTGSSLSEEDEMLKLLDGLLG